MSDLLSFWLGVNVHVGSLLNTPLIEDPALSYIAVTGVRVLVIGLIWLAVRRISQLLLVLPRRQRDEWLRAYLKTPWWRTPALMIVLGLAGVGTMLFFQTLAGNLDPQRNPLGNLTAYTLLANFWLSVAVFGVALGAGAWRRQVRTPTLAAA